MKVLVLGSGAKEHVIAWSFSRSRRISGLYVAPGNAGTAEIAENLPEISLHDPEAIVKACRDHRINYVFAASARAQVAGAVDALQEEGIPVFGAPSRSARLEDDRVFAKEFMERYGVPTNPWRAFSDYDEFVSFLDEQNGYHVVKRNKTTHQGHATIDADDRKTLLDFAANALESGPIIAEPFTRGYNLSIFALTDGHNYTILPPTSDYTRAEENEGGIITSGMGAVCPIPILGDELYSKIIDTVVEPTFRGMREEGLCYKGVFFFSLLITGGEEVVVTSYHVRFGDPEAQVLLPLIKSDFGNLAEAIDQQRLGEFDIHYSNDSAVGVVIASDGYPRNSPKSHYVRLRNDIPEEEALVFHGATAGDGNGGIVTEGGRCFTIVGLGENLLRAHHHAYRHLDAVDFPGAWSRTDIGNRFINI